MIKILVLHGLGSGANNGTAKVIEQIEGASVYAPEVPIDPLEAVKKVQEYNDSFQPDLIVGTSMGGFYTMTIKTSAKKLLINPAMNIALDIKLGILKDNVELVQNYTKIRSDGALTYTLNDEFIDKLRKIYYEFVLDNPILADRSKISGLFGINDELFHHADDYKYAYNDDYKMIPTKHHLERSELVEYVLPKVLEIINE